MADVKTAAPPELPPVPPMWPVPPDGSPSEKQRRRAEALTDLTNWRSECIRSQFGRYGHGADKDDVFLDDKSLGVFQAPCRVQANSSGRARTVGPDTGTASTSGSSSWLNPTRISYVAAADRRRQRLLKRIDERQATPSTSAASSTQKTEEEAEERLQGEQAPKISMTRGRWPINVWTDEVEVAVKTTVSTAAPTGGSKEWSFTPPTTPRVLATPRTQARLLRRIRLGSSERPEKRNAEEHGGTPAVASAREDVDDSVQCLTWFPTTAARVQPQVDAEPLPTWRRPVSRRRLNKYLKRDAIEQEPPVETVTELSVGSVLDLDYHCEPHYHSEPHVGTTFEPLLGVDADVRYYSAPAAQSEEVGGSQVRRLRLLRSRHQETGDTEATRSSRRELLHSLLES